MHALKQAAEYIKDIIGDFKPQIGIVLGSGLGDILQQMQEIARVPYTDIPEFPSSTAPGHLGQFLFGYYAGKPCVIMQGRIHYYEGYTMQQVVMPIRLMGMLGIGNLLLTNAAGGINSHFRPGELMMITDHISTFIPSPLLGKNLDPLGTRFPDMTQVYSCELQEKLLNSARNCNILLQKGVYVQVSGPQYETPAEICMLKALGADAVGMSTVCEAIAARHMGIQVCGISCITNMAAGLNSAPLSHQEVQAMGKAVIPKFSSLISDFISGL